MDKISFDNLPEAISSLLHKVEKIESLLHNLSPQFDDSSEPLTIEQASEILNLAVSTIYGKVSRREIPVNKKGKHLYFFKNELLEWLKEGKRSTNDSSTANAASFLRRKR